MSEPSIERTVIGAAKSFAGVHDEQTLATKMSLFLSRMQQRQKLVRESKRKERHTTKNNTSKSKSGDVHDNEENRCRQNQHSQPNRMLTQQRVINTKKERTTHHNKSMHKGNLTECNFVSNMEKRNHERKVRRDRLRQTYTVRSEKAEKERLRKEEEERREIEVSKKKSSEKRKRDRELALARKAYMEHFSKLNNLANMYRTHALVWFYGIQPWKKAVEIRRLHLIKAKNHSQRRITRTMLRTWRSQSQKQIEARRYMAIRQHNHTVLRRAWMGFRQYHVYLVRVETFIRCRHRTVSLGKHFKTMRECFDQRMERRLVQKEMVRRLEERHCLRRHFHGWLDALEELAQERILQERIKGTWQKINCWLEEEDDSIW